MLCKGCVRGRSDSLVQLKRSFSWLFVATIEAKKKLRKTR